MIGEGEGGYQSPEFHKNCGLSVDFFLPSAGLCTDHAEIWYETIYCRRGVERAKFEPNR